MSPSGTPFYSRKKHLIGPFQAVIQHYSIRYQLLAVARPQPQPHSHSHEPHTIVFEQPEAPAPRVSCTARQKNTIRP